MSSHRKTRKSISNDVKLASVLALKKKEKTQQQIAAELNVKEVAAIMGVADKVLMLGTMKQTTLHSFFQ